MHRVLASIALSTALLGTAAAAGVADIVKPHNLSAQLPWLEGQVGPAFKVEGATRIYKIGDCEVGVITDKDEIRAFRVLNTPACAFDLKAFVPNYDLPANADLTFGAFENAAGSIDYYADCLKQCGNAYNPSVYGYRPGGRVDNMISITLESELVTDDAIDASFVWEKAMTQSEGEAYVIDGKYNCDPKYNAVVASAFKAIKPSAIVVGIHDKPAIQTCQD